MRSSVILTALLGIFILTAYWLLTAPKPSQYLKEDAELQTNSQPKDPKEDIEMSVKEFVDHTIKSNKVVIW